MKRHLLHLFPVLAILLFSLFMVNPTFAKQNEMRFTTTTGNETLSVNQPISIQINRPDSSLKAWLNKNRNNLRLFVNYVPIENQPVTLSSYSAQQYIYTFETVDSAHIRKLAPYITLWQGTKTLQMGLGTPNDGMHASLTYVPKQVVFYTSSEQTLMIWILIAYAIVFLIIIGYYSNFIRNSSILPEVNNGTVRPSYSFAKTQLAFWTCIISAAIIYQYFISDGMVEINNTMLSLLTLSALTTGVAHVIDRNDEAEEQKGLLTRHQNKANNQFFKDILSDQNGLSINRFQTLIFNLIGATVFIYETFGGITFAELDEKLLFLMGVSSVTYLGLKFRENKANAAPDPNPGGDGN